jgi:hypothetical protein
MRYSGRGDPKQLGMAHWAGWQSVHKAACHTLTLRYNRKFHKEALPLFWQIRALSEAYIQSREDQPYTTKGATEEEVGAWKGRNERLLPYLYSRVGFMTTFTTE